MKQLETLSTVIHLSLDELYDSYVDINSNLQLQITIYNSVFYKTNI